jgi:hypothetical protein
VEERPPVVPTTGTGGVEGGALLRFGGTLGASRMMELATGRRWQRTGLVSHGLGSPT